MDFCYITPTRYLDIFASGRRSHLILAHLVEEDKEYAKWYEAEKKRTNCTIILDNSAFEMYKRNLPMYDSKKLLTMAKKVSADYVVMSDYPGEPAIKTQNKAEEMGPELKKNGFKTFFCPQSRVGEHDELVESFMWAADQPFVDYIGLSILNIPNAYGVEKENKLQRFLSRWKFVYTLKARGFFYKTKANNKKIHLLGMLDGPNEVWLLKDFLHYFNTWDSSAAVWAGLNGIKFDRSPTGLINGKFEEEVDFNHSTATIDDVGLAMQNMKYIDNIIEKVLNEPKL